MRSKRASIKGCVGVGERDVIIACECVCAAALCSIYLVHFKSDYLKQQAASTMCGFAGSSSSSNVWQAGNLLPENGAQLVRATVGVIYLPHSLDSCLQIVYYYYLQFAGANTCLPCISSRPVTLIDTCHTAINVAVQCKLCCQRAGMQRGPSTVQHVELENMEMSRIYDMIR